MRAEMAKIESTLQKNLEQKQKYNEEMARLGQETERQLQVQKAKLDDLTKDEMEDTSGVYSPVKPHNQLPLLGSFSKQQTYYVVPMDPETPTSDEGEIKQIDSAIEPANNNDAIEQPTTVPPHVGSPNRFEQDVDLASFSASTEDSSLPHENGLDSNHGPGDPQIFGSSDNNSAVQVDRASADHALEAALQEAVRAEADEHHEEVDIEMEASHAPDPDQLAPESPLATEQGSPIYSPLIRRASGGSVGESEDYEPPEATPPPQSPPFSPAPPDHDDLSIIDESMQDIIDPSLQTISDTTSKDNVQQDVEGTFLSNGSGAPMSSDAVIYTPPHIHRC